MKAKTINRKLFLNKKTIADLNGSQMKHLKGGFKNLPNPCANTDAISNCPSGFTCPSECSLGGICC
jgi:hypothetical protein